MNFSRLLNLSALSFTNKAEVSIETDLSGDREAGLSFIASSDHLRANIPTTLGFYSIEDNRLSIDVHRSLPWYPLSKPDSEYTTSLGEASIAIRYNPRIQHHVDIES